jgi:acyl-CoA thioesterase FadM/ketosteroid isomerase-like protein
VSPEEILERFMECQLAMYAGGPMEPVAELLDEGVVWHVPGSTPIAGDHRGRAAVLAYFAHRRARAGGTLRITEHAQLQDGDTVVRLADGEARLGGTQQRWRTVGVYRIAGDRLVEAWLVPLDSGKFEGAWGAARGAPFTYEQRVLPQDCAANEVLGRPRLLEIFEAGVIEFWRAHFGPLASSLEGRGLTLASVQASFRAPVRVNDMVGVEVFLDSVGCTSIGICCTASGSDGIAATTTSRYVCVDTDGQQTPWPAVIEDSLWRLVETAGSAR